MKKFTILAGAALAVVAGVAAIAQQPAAAPGAHRNADVTRQQALQHVEQRFARLDVNRDGRATPEEARQVREQRRAERAGRMFERLDLDRNGSVTRAEFDQSRAQRAERRAERGAANGEGRGFRGRHGRRGGMHGMRGMRGERLFGEQGFVTLEQMRERSIARFDRLDANRDGTLTAAERRQAREQRRQERRARNG